MQKCSNNFVKQLKNKLSQGIFSVNAMLNKTKSTICELYYLYEVINNNDMNFTFIAPSYDRAYPEFYNSDSWPSSEIRHALPTNL